MYKTIFLHHHVRFGIVVEDWGDCTAGAEIAADRLEKWVRNLSLSDTRAIHADLVESGPACSDDPIMESPRLLAYWEARADAERTGAAVSGADVNDGHRRTCNLRPLES
jgi:hypothetical protein